MKTLLVAATHRSGSYLACDRLSQAAKLPFPEEHFNFNLKSAREELNLSESVPSNKVLNALMERRMQIHGIFTVKSMWPAYATIFHELAGEQSGASQNFELTSLKWLGRPSVIFIRRRDKVRQAVSFEIAKQSGVWRRCGEEKSEVVNLLYSYPRILACWQQIQRDEASWLNFFKSHKLVYHEIWYEDLVTKPIEEIRRALKFMGVNVKSDVMAESRFSKLSNGINRDWAERFRARLGIDAETVYKVNAASLPKGSTTNFYAPESVNCASTVSIHIPEPRIVMKPYESKILTVQLKNDGRSSWQPKLTPYKGSDYALKLISPETKDGEPLWETELEQVVRSGEITLLTLRLKSDFCFKPFKCDLHFTHPGGRKVVTETFFVDIQMEANWEVIKKIFKTIEPSQKSGWIYVKDLGDIWIEKFPFIFLNEHGWLFVHEESSSPGIICAMDSELCYIAIHLDRPKDFNVFVKDSPRADLFEFLGVERGLRRFKDVKNNLLRSVSLSKWDK